MEGMENIFDKLSKVIEKDMIEKTIESIESIIDGAEAEYRKNPNEFAFEAMNKAFIEMAASSLEKQNFWLMLFVLKSLYKERIGQEITDTEKYFADLLDKARKGAGK